MRTILFVFLVLVCINCAGCESRYKNQKPDDTISTNISDVLGEDVYYEGNEIENHSDKYWYGGTNPDDDIIVYTYLIHNYENENILKDVVDVVNEELKEMQEQKVKVVFTELILKGQETVATICNYSKDEKEIYDKLQRLTIYGTDMSEKGESSPYNYSVVYIKLKDIKFL